MNATKDPVYAGIGNQHGLRSPHAEVADFAGREARAALEAADEASPVSLAYVSNGHSAAMTNPEGIIAAVKALTYTTMEQTAVLAAAVDRVATALENPPQPNDQMPALASALNRIATALENPPHPAPDNTVAIAAALDRVVAVLERPALVPVPPTPVVRRRWYQRKEG